MGWGGQCDAVYFEVDARFFILENLWALGEIHGGSISVAVTNCCFCCTIGMHFIRSVVGYTPSFYAVL